MRATEALIAALDPELNGELREVLLYAAGLLDIGRSVDFYNRHEHTTSIVLAADLSGFAHRAIALLAAIVRLADKDGASLKSVCAAGRRSRSGRAVPRGRDSGSR